MTAGASRAAPTIAPQPALAPSPQPRPAPTARALPPGLVEQGGQNWTPIGGQICKPIDSGDSPVEFMRHYYDVYSLLRRPDVQAFIGTDEYKAHKAKRFPRADKQNIAQNEAFILSDPATRTLYDDAFAASGALYYGAKPSFDQILDAIKKWIRSVVIAPPG